MEYTSSPEAQPGTQIRSGSWGRAILKECGENHLRQTHKVSGITKKAGYPNKKILGQRLNFVRLLSQQIDIFGESINLTQSHASRQPSLHGTALVA